MTSKNTLQEYFQSRRLPSSQYFTERCGGSDHSPLWQSRVIFWSVKNSTFGEVTGNIASTKVRAEMSAAELALDILTNENNGSISGETDNSTFNLPPSNILDISQIHDKKIKVEGKTALFVDVENLPKFIDEVVQQVSGIDIYAFVGYHHCLSGKVFPENVVKVLSPSTRSDGSDTCMQVYIGYMLAHKTYDTYLIATRDHYGSALVDMITTDSLLWKNADGRVVTQVSHI